MSLLTTTLELWPLQAKAILKEKNINTRELKSELEEIYFPWNDRYNALRDYYSLRIQIRPLFIIRPVNTKEIEFVLNFIKEKQLTIAVCAGRHTSHLVSPEVLVDMANFNKIKFNEKTGILKLGSAVTQGQANAFLFEESKFDNVYSHFGKFMHPQTHVEAFPAGSAASVSNAGISGVGGIGTLKRTYGLTVDFILKFKITLPPTETAKSKTVYATKDCNSDLYFALTGGMLSNFGIVSRIYYDIVIVPDLVEYNIDYSNFSQTVDILDTWQSTATNRPDNYNEEINVFASGGGTNRIKATAVTGFYLLHKEETFEQAQVAITKELAPIIAPFAATLKIHPTISYSNLYRKLVKNRIYRNFSMIQALFINHCDSEDVVKSINQGFRLENEGNVLVSLDLMGGRINNGNTSTSFAFRDRNFFLDITSNCEPLNSLQGIQKWEEETLKRFLLPENFMYVAFPITFSDIKIDDSIYYAQSYPRLQEIKAKIDPLNLLTPTGTIQPGGYGLKEKKE